MNSYVELVALVEGGAELIFLRDLVAPHLTQFAVYLYPTLLSKPGQKGGDVKFERAQIDIRNHLRQRPDTFLTLFIDFYGTNSSWPGLASARLQQTPRQKATIFHEATKEEVVRLFGEDRAAERFIPYVSMHEFEALLFSDPQILANGLGVFQKDVDAILSKCGEPEAINDNPNSAPSKRLATLSDKRFGKKTTGIDIAKKIGLATMRRQCPLFNEWLTRLEDLTPIPRSAR